MDFAETIESTNDTVSGVPSRSLDPRGFSRAELHNREGPDLSPINQRVMNGVHCLAFIAILRQQHRAARRSLPFPSPNMEYHGSVGPMGALPVDRQALSAKEPIQTLFYEPSPLGNRLSKPTA